MQATEEHLAKYLVDFMEIRCAVGIFCSDKPDTHYMLFHKYSREYT